MAKYLILYHSPVAAKELMAQSSPEQMKASMQSWIKWKEAAEHSFKFEWGLPLQGVGHITPDGVQPSQSRASGYSIIESDSKDEMLAQLRRHPHLEMTPGGSIDVLEMVPMPGMEAGA